VPSRPHVIYLAIGFPPAAKSSTYRLRATANELAAQGARVTVVTLRDEQWELESGLDQSLLDGVDPSIRVVKLDLRRFDLDPRVDTYGPVRAHLPRVWSRLQGRLTTLAFPERPFGRWRRGLVRAVEALHATDPADLVLASMAPYTTIAAATALHRRHGVPYALDYRDGWSIDVIGGGAAFGPRSRAGRIERRAVEAARSLWFVNDAIADFYRSRYPHAADRMHVVRNGYDPIGTVPARVATTPLRFGYLGTASFPLDYTRELLDGWRLARERDPRLRDATIEFRGHFGARASGVANSHTRRIAGASAAGASSGGPVPKAQVAALYGGWDVLVFMMPGGRFTTSGKIYEYMSTGRPILSVHEPDHGAGEVLEGYGPWVRPPAELVAAQLADRIVEAADVALRMTADDRAAALEHAASFERGRILEPAVRALLDDVDELRGEVGTSASDVRKVLLVGAVRPEWQRTKEVVAELASYGVEPTLAGPFDMRTFASTGLRSSRTTRVSRGRLRSGRRPRRFTPAWAWLVLRDRAIPHLERRGPRRQLEVAAWWDNDLRSLARRSEAVVALDGGALVAARRLAREAHVPGYLGTGPLVRALPPLRRALVAWRSPQVAGHRSEDLVGAAHLLTALEPDDPRRTELDRAPAVVGTLRGRGRPGEAREVVDTVLHHDPPETLRARLELAGDLVDLEAAGDVDTRILAEHAVRVVAAADVELAAGHLRPAVDLALEAARALYHRDLHAAREWSPLVANPAEYLGPLHTSATFRALARGPRSAAGPRPAVPGPTRRLLVVTAGNLHFARPVLAELEAAGVEIRTLDLTAESSRWDRYWHWNQLADRLARELDEPVPPISEATRELLEWPDTVFVDWCDHAASWASFHVPPHVRLVLRVHSIDALSIEPLLVDFAGVDDVVFIAPHIRAFLAEAVPELSRAARVHLVPNAIALEGFTPDKTPAAARTLGVIGWAQPVKDPLWAVELLAALRREDPAWNLRLVGKPFAASQTPRGDRYVRQWHERVRQNDVRDAITYVEYTDDLPTELREIGFVVSSSVREGAPVSVVEAAAAACVPVVRSWPVFARYDAARGVFPGEWVVDELGTARARVLAHADDDARASAGASARDWALAQGGLTATRSLYAALFGVG
jgi:glycosyltransferase involved in cell wall biosynthesis